MKITGEIYSLEKRSCSYAARDGYFILINKNGPICQIYMDADELKKYKLGDKVTIEVTKE